MNFTKSIINKDAFNSKILGQQQYVDENGNAPKAVNIKKLYIIIGSIVGIILLSVIIFIVANNGAKNSKCNSIENMLKDAGYKYAESKGTLPTIVSDPITYDVSELMENGYINSKDFSINDTTCGGTVKITNVGDSYIETVNVTNCNFCTTDTRYGTNWSAESDKKPNSGVYDVVIYYNYQTKTVNHTEWTSYYTPDELKSDPMEKTDDTRLSSIPADAKNVVIDHDDLTYYRYQDKEWKFYRNPNNNYSALSCTQPSGYSNQDYNTEFQTGWTDWSLNSPEQSKCITIDTQTGYRWYKEDNGNKVYWNGGAYSPDNPDQENESYKQDTKDSATVWRYYKTLYRWYNGDEREYSGYIPESDGYFIYKDSELTSNSDWSNWDTTSYLNSSNSSYRTQETQVRTRYRLTYDEYSLDILVSYLTKADFEAKLGRSLADINNDQNYVLQIQYKYIYRKK